MMHLSTSSHLRHPRHCATYQGGNLADLSDAENISMVCSKDSAGFVDMSRSRYEKDESNVAALLEQSYDLNQLATCKCLGSATNSNGTLVDHTV